MRGDGIPNAEVGRYYASAAIVLNDHWHDMRAEGFISNRIYDALACGAFVISDQVEGIEAEFDGAVVTYRERPELEALIERYLGDPDGAGAARGTRPGGRPRAAHVRPAGGGDPRCRRPPAPATWRGLIAGAGQTAVEPPSSSATCRPNGNCGAVDR